MDKKVESSVGFRAQGVEQKQLQVLLSGLLFRNLN